MSIPRKKIKQINHALDELQKLRTLLLEVTPTIQRQAPGLELDDVARLLDHLGLRLCLRLKHQTTYLLQDQAEGIEETEEAEETPVTKAQHFQ